MSLIILGKHPVTGEKWWHHDFGVPFTPEEMAAKAAEDKERWERTAVEILNQPFETPNGNIAPIGGDFTPFVPARELVRCDCSGGRILTYSCVGICECGYCPDVGECPKCKGTGWIEC